MSWTSSPHKSLMGPNWWQWPFHLKSCCHSALIAVAGPDVVFRLWDSQLWLRNITGQMPFPLLIRKEDQNTPIMQGAKVQVFDRLRALSISFQLSVISVYVIGRDRNHGTFHIISHWHDTHGMLTDLEVHSKILFAWEYEKLMKIWVSSLSKWGFCVQSSRYAHMFLKYDRLLHLLLLLSLG